MAHRRLISLTAIVLVSAACSDTGGPATSRVPATGPATTTPATTTPATSTTVATHTLTLYFPNPGLAGDDPCGAVFPAERIVHDGSNEPARPALEALFAGPTPEERASGFEPVAASPPSVNIDESESGTVVVDFIGLFDTDPALADVCPGRALQRAIDGTLGALEMPDLERLEYRLDGDVAAFHDRVGTHCPLEPAPPAPGTVLVYFHCSPGEPPVPISRPAGTATSTEDLLRVALGAQTAGPEVQERAAGATSALAADHLAVRNATVEGSTAAVDFQVTHGSPGSFATSDGTTRSIAELLPVVFQFTDVDTASLTLDGSCEDFYARLEGPCHTPTRDDARRALLSGRDRQAVNAMLDDLALLTAGGPREAGTEAERAAGDYLAGRLAGTGAEVGIGQIPLPSGSTTRNVSATYGVGPLHVLVGAHYDSVRVSPGADDNGSGVVVLLELARRLATETPDGLTVTVAFFGAEEVLSGYGGDNHHFGSRTMAEAMAASATLPDRMVSVDMVGLGDRLLAVTYLDTNATVAAALAAAGAETGVDIIEAAKGDISDHEGFARAGVPAAMLWRPDNPAWHTPGDDRVDDLLLLEDLWVVERYLDNLAGA